jgi:hypothetical protein
MNATIASAELKRLARADIPAAPGYPGVRWSIALLCVGCVGWMMRGMPGWVAMWILAATEFAALKFVTLHGAVGTAPWWRIAAYLFLWPGMNAAAFLHDRRAAGPAPEAIEMSAALVKTVFGVALMSWASTHGVNGNPWLVAWVGMFGLIFALHFGALHVVSWIWRRFGFVAPSIMRAPIAATSLANLWGERWNIAFADAARRFLLRPLARRYGVRAAGAIVFLISGLVHETVISLPARGGWGGPTLYFLLQGAGIALEKSAFGLRAGLGSGIRGRLWTLLVAVAPIPLLFHGAFVRNVIVPFYRMLNAVLP